MPVKRGASVYIGHVLRPLREKAGWSTGQLSKRTHEVAAELGAGEGLSDSYIRNLENNHREPSLSALRLLALALRVKPRVFCEAPPPPPGASDETKDHARLGAR